MRRHFIFAVLCLVVAGARADVTGEVVRVIDGDTLDVLVDRQPIRIRLAEIDAPEKAQPFGTRARQVLAAIVYRHVVTVREAGTDRYGRTIGTVVLDGRSVNRQMVEQGMAWAYTRYLVDRSLIGVEAAARAQKLGLWADANPVAPWDWRAAKRLEAGF